MPNQILTEAHVRIKREQLAPYTQPLQWFTLEVTVGKETFTEELEPGDEVMDWFRIRGADMQVVEKAIDYAWNFYKAEITIANYKEPGFQGKHAPRV